MKYCSHCGNEINEDAIVCVGCGRSCETKKKDCTALIFGILSIVIALGYLFLRNMPFYLFFVFYSCAGSTGWITVATFIHKRNILNFIGLILGIASIILIYVTATFILHGAF